ncbi:DUF4142 domain-containing protein [Pseudoxanthomonas sp. JBR18]|uniref:DUF4142 domain-containing protein n=1 Tax=Pseudoxanthomonas sp. JBR18 TaxID=2969308 RepID=UPI002305F04C|nr:DUF4142 domain-containing protein [Pseudoxanthomonas sp. JBR18]WCE03874.1 DUF4142 domain-containing protein [Pseudoxanthomonas sp. JBR18]
MRTLLSCTVVLMLATGCTSPSKDGRSHSTVGPHAAQAVSRSDAQILSVVSAINHNEIAIAQQARSRKLAAGVGNYASMMIQDHSANQKEIERLGTPVASERSQAGLAEGQALESALAAHDADYSRAYMEAMVKEHVKALDLLQNTLLPQAEAEGVKAHLMNTRTSVQNHLKAARSLEDTLERANPS